MSTSAADNDGLRGQSDMSGPCAKSIDIDAEKHATNYLSSVIRAIYCETTAGTVKFHVLHDEAATYRTVTLAIGQKFDMYYIDRVYAIGTTATGLLGGV